MNTPTHLGPIPYTADVPAMNPYSFELMSSTSTSVPLMWEKTPKVHETVA